MESSTSSSTTIVGGSAAAGSSSSSESRSRGGALRFDFPTRPLTSLSSSSSAATAADALMMEAFASSPSPPSPPSPPAGRQSMGTPQLFAWQEDTTSSFSTSSFFSLPSNTAPARLSSSQPSRAVDMPDFIRSASDPTLHVASTASAQSSPTASSVATSVSLPPPALHLLPDSPRYVDTYLSLVSTDLYSFFDDEVFRALYLEHIIHTAEPQPRGENRARLLCVSSVLAIGARIYGNSAYSAQCSGVARYCAQSIQDARPTSTEDIALAYRGMLLLSYLSAAVLDPSEAVWLSVAESLLSVSGARALIPASMMHVLRLMPPTFMDALSLPADDVCEQVAQRQMQLYSADLTKYRRCKRLLRQLISVPDDDEELRAAQEEPPGEGPAAIAASLTSCCPGRLVALHRSVCLALSNVHRRTSLSVSVYDILTTLLCCEAAALPTNQRSGVYATKLSCYLLLGRKKEAVQAARDTLQFYTGPGRVTSQSNPDHGLLLPFALSFVRSIVVLSEWDDSHDVPSLFTAALRLFHGVSLSWPAARNGEAELMDRLHGKCRVEMSRATGQTELQRSGGSGESQGSSVHSDTGRLQVAIRMELALEALEIEWQNHSKES